MAKQLPWDEQTDGFISDLDETVSTKYKLSLRSLLMNPNKYIGKKEMGKTISGIKSDVADYFVALLDDLKEEQTKLQTELEGADTQYRQVDSVITTKSAAARVPYVRPLFVSRSPDKEESIVFDKYDDSLEPLIGKLLMASHYVADMSATYKNYRLGSWVFSGVKNYVLTINPPESPVLVIENSRNIINEMLDSTASRASQ